MVVVVYRVAPGFRILPMRFGNGMARSSKSYRCWTPAELDKLEELVGQTAFDRVCQRWNHWAKGQGIPERSQQSLRKKAQENGWTVFAWGDWVLVGEVARLTGKHRSAIHKWIAAGWLTREGKARASAVSRLELRRLARQRPQLFGGIERSRLVQLLEVEDLVDQILEQCPKGWQSRTNGQRVRWVNRGQTFGSYAAAGRAAHIDPHAIRQGIAEGRLVCGHRFELMA